MDPRGDPHRDQPARTAGVPLERARAAVIIVHGRGATAGDILTLADELVATDFDFLAPQAAGNTWYPNRFLAPLASNEPYLSSALAAVGAARPAVRRGRNRAGARRPARLLARRLPGAGVRGPQRPALRRRGRAERRPDRSARHPAGTTPARWLARPSSSAAATSTSTSRWRASTRRPTCCAASAARWRRGSTPGWATRSTRTRSRSSRTCST